MIVPLLYSQKWQDGFHANPTKNYLHENRKQGKFIQRAQFSE